MPTPYGMSICRTCQTVYKLKFTRFRCYLTDLKMRIINPRCQMWHRLVLPSLSDLLAESPMHCKVSQKFLLRKPF